MVAVLPLNILQVVREKVPCRENQCQQLSIYYNQYLPAPPTLVAHGLEHSAKLETITALLEASNIQHAVIQCRECLSQRHLLAKIFATCIRRLGQVQNVERYDRIDNLNSLVVNLQKLFAEGESTFVLVLDGIDRQQGASPTLLPALARLGDLVSGFSVILTSSSPRTLNLRRPGVPVITFPPYTRAEAITTIALRSQELVPQNLPEDFPEVSETQVKNIYTSYVTTVYDTLIDHTSSTSLPTFQRTCAELWPRFVWPLISGEPIPSRTSNMSSSSPKWDFARLLARGRPLFQVQGEKALQSSLTADPKEARTFEQLIQQHSNADSSTRSYFLNPVSEPKQEIPLLKFFSTLLLVSSYLASHGPAKHDIIIFSRLSSSSTNKRKYLTSALSKSRTTGVRKTPTKKQRTTAMSDTNGGNDGGGGGDETPSKRRKNGAGEGLASEKTPKSTRLLLEKTSNIPRPFTLERVIAVLRAVHPEGLSRTRGAADRVYAEMAELERLRLVVRCSGTGEGGTGARTGDDGILEEKWRVNVSREFVIGVGRRWGIGLEGWEIE